MRNPDPAEFSKFFKRNIPPEHTKKRNIPFLTRNVRLFHLYFDNNLNFSIFLLRQFLTKDVLSLN